MPDNDPFSDVSSQSFLEYARSKASRNDTLSSEEKKIDSLYLIGLMMRYIYVGSDDYQQKTEDLQKIKTILLDNGNLLKKEASIEFVTTKLGNHFKTKPGFQFNREVIMSNVRSLFNMEEQNNIEIPLNLLYKDFRTMNKSQSTQKTHISFPSSVPNDDSPSQLCFFPESSVRSLQLIKSEEKTFEEETFFI